MIIKLSKEEQKTLASLDPQGKGTRIWQSAREVAGGVFRKKPDNIDQKAIRAVRNAFRKLVREGLVEMSAASRGHYRITEQGRKISKSGKTEFDGRFERGKATEEAKKAGKARMKERPKTTKVQAKPKKVEKKAKVKTKAKSKKETTKKTKPTSKKSSTKKSKTTQKAKSKVEVVDKTEENQVEKVTFESNNGERKKPKFVRRQALKYANGQSA